MLSGQRTSPRVAVGGLCNEIVGDEDGDRYASVLDLSPLGLRIERPHRGGIVPAEVRLELQVPGIDEVLWALGEVRFDHVRQVKGCTSSPRLVHTTGLCIRAAATRDLRLLRDYVHARAESAARRFVHADARWTPALAWARPCDD